MNQDVIDNLKQEWEGTVLPRARRLDVNGDGIRDVLLGWLIGKGVPIAATQQLLDRFET